MNVLLVTDRLDLRGGTQSFLRDLIHGLQALEHSAIIYCANTDRGGLLFENESLPIASNIEDLPFVPDLIHVQQHLYAMAAIAALPGVPAVYHCHGAVWRGCVPRHPAIRRYIAMSKTLAERMMVESNIAPSDIDVVLNCIDLQRFRLGRKPSARPARALFYNSRHQSDSDTVLAVREAASRCQLQLDCIGYHFHRVITNPETILPEYDIVFASGISAIEAMACGCAVVVIGRTGCGELVRPENFDRYRQVNFSIAANSPPPSAGTIEKELRSYTAEDCEAVSARLRREADVQLTVRQVLKIYDRVLEPQQSPQDESHAAMIALSHYFQKIAPLMEMTDGMLRGDWDSAAGANSPEELREQLRLIECRLNKV